jgi:two-component system, OmpR family, sensor histidine kinase BaeS
MNSLSIKLSALFVGLALISIGIVAIWVNQSVKANFVDYCERQTCTCDPSGAPMQSGIGQSEQQFIDDSQRSLLLAALVAIGIAILLGLFMSKLITRPMQQLALSARKIASGDLAQRVKHKSDDEVGEVSNAFNTMAEQLEKKEKSRKQLLADIAHELRNPLCIVQGNLEAWLDGVIAPTPEQIASVYDETVLLNRLINDLRELSLAEAGQLRLHLEKADLAELITAEITGFQARSQEKHISVNADLVANLPAVNIDRDRLRQVLHNLLENALRYTSPGGMIKVAAAMNTGQQIQISVSDNGTGINKDDLPYVFDHFYKADKSRQRVYGGAGIGLALVKKYVELHGGEVWVHSEVGRGSTFYFTLPVGDTI